MARTIVDDIFEMTDTIMGEISNSVDRGEFYGLGDNIRRQMNGFNNMNGRTTYAGDRGVYDINRVSYTSGRYDRQTEAERKARAAMQARKKAPFMRKKPGKNKGVGLMVLGIIGMLLFLPGVIGAASVGTVIVGGAFVGASAYAFFNGWRNNRLTKKFFKYASLVGTAEYIDIKDLARKADETPEQVTKNLEKMIQKGMLPYAVFDEQKTSLILTEEAYSQYEAAVAASRARKAEQEAAEAEEEEAQGGTKESRRVIKEGEAFLREIRAANNLIAEPEMSEKLSRLEEIVQKIIDQVRRDPTNAAALRKFMNYYVPTTQKLIKAYVELNEQPEVGENITRTKHEIEDAIDAVNGASDVLLNNLFEDVAWDIASDISVMKTMMEQDGLTQQSPKKQAAQQSAGQADPQAQAAPQTQTMGGAQAQAAPQTQTMGGAQAQAAQMMEEE